MNSEINFCLDDLPDICRTDQDIEDLFIDIYEIKQSSFNDNYQRLFRPIGFPNPIEILKNVKNDLYHEFSSLPKSASKKDIAKVFLSEISDNRTQRTLLIYLSGLYDLKFLDSNTNDEINWFYQEVYIELSNNNEHYFLELHGRQVKDFVIKGDPDSKSIEPIFFTNVEKVRFVTKGNLFFNRMSFVGIELIPSRIDCYRLDGVRSVADLNGAIFKNLGGTIRVENVQDNQLQVKFVNLKNYILSLYHCSCDLFVEKNVRGLDIVDCDLSVLNFKNSNFRKVPYFDDKSSIKHSVDIDKATFDNLQDVENAGSLEFSRLAEFFNRNNAYMEAQQLHRHYLLAKAKESLNEESKEDKKTNKNKPSFYKKWTGLSGLINIYDFINGCGTSLLKPFIGVLYCWLFTYLIFLSSSIKLVMSVKSTGVIVYSSYSVLFSIKQALLVTVPLLATIHKPEIEMLDNGLLQIFVYFLMIVSYLLVFLMALQIRKLLRLKE